MKHILSTLLLLLCLCGGCQSSSPTPPQNLRINIQGDLASLHPFTGIDLNCRSIQIALFEGLTRIAPDGKAHLAGAESVDISPSQTVYTFRLRPLSWSNGEPLTAYHYEASWKQGIAKGSDCLRPDLFYPIKHAKKIKQGELPIKHAGVYALDAYTLVVELEHPTPFFLDLVASPLYAPLYDESKTPSIFNGPFLVTKWEHDSFMQLTKNPHYWDATSVSLDGIDISFVQDPNTALLMYEKGEVDLAGNPFCFLPLDVLARIDETHTLHSKPVAGVFWLCCNTTSFPLTSPSIRKALSYAVDRQALAQHLLHGETPARSMLPLTMSLQNDHHYPDADATTARLLFEEGLKELGLTRETFPPIQFSYSDVADQRKIAEALQSRWEEVLGIDVQLLGSDWNVFFASLGERQFQLGGCIWFSLYNDPIYNLAFFKELSHRYNAPGWENAHYRDLLDLASQEIDPTKRLEHLCAAEKIILDEMPIIPLYVVNYKNLIADKVEGIYISDLGMIDFKWTHLRQD